MPHRIRVADRFMRQSAEQLVTMAGAVHDLSGRQRRILRATAGGKESSFANIHPQTLSQESTSVYLTIICSMGEGTFL